MQADRNPTDQTYLKLAGELPSSINAEPLTPANLSWYKPSRRPIAEILADLSKAIPKKYLDKLPPEKGNALYIPWHIAVRLLNRCTGGHWDYYITNIHTTNERIFITARIVIHAQEGAFTREAMGTELLKREVFDAELDETIAKEIVYGDPSSNAESMALRRAAAKFGLALYLYDG